MARTALDKMITLTGFEELAQVLKSQLPDAVQNRIVKNAMYKTINNKVIPLIKAQIKAQGLIRTGSLEASITIVKQDFKNKLLPRLVVGPATLSEEQAFITMVSKYRAPFYARFLERGTHRMSKNGVTCGIEARQYMLKSYFTIKVKYAEWLKEALLDEFTQYKERELRKFFKKK